VRPRRGNTVTLARALSKLGILSRTQAAAAIVAGRVAVGGRIERDPEHWLDPERSKIALDGKVVTKQQAIYYALHKPVGYVTTRADERGRQTIYDLLPADLPWLFPVGRLDKDSSGLLLLTNDTRFADSVSDPSQKWPKVYEVTLDAPLSDADTTLFRAGMTLADGTALLPVDLEFPVAEARAHLRLTLREGKNRQIRRMAEHCGRRVLTLHRVAVGAIRLGDLREGALRRLAIVPSP
jgi:23S rRNA pseudouridine2605 synthase